MMDRHTGEIIWEGHGDDCYNYYYLNGLTIVMTTATLLMSCYE